MNDTWKAYAADLNAMTDEEIERECRFSREQIEAEENWLEAVESWKAAGKPRNKGAEE